jgi:hypothetical protein
MMNLQDFRMALHETHPGFRIDTNPRSARQNHTRKRRQEPTHSIKFNQDYFLAFLASELANENARAQLSVNRKQPVMCMDNSMEHNVGKIRQYLARKKITRARHRPPLISVP